MNQTLFFYDLETSGLKSREDRIMQFAGQRTDLSLVPIGEPVNILVKITDDTLPSPYAINVTKITPQKTILEGISEPEFCRYVTEEIFTPGTVAMGYNTVRFDDEFMRAMFWRNFYDPYEWEWKDGRSRWDMLDVVRLTRALRPEGINWPVTAEGKPTNRLELLTKMNGLSHEHAHDALSDVYATIAVAKLIHERQPNLFQFLFEMRSKREVTKLVSLENPKPVVYSSGRYSNEFNKTTVVVPVAPGRNGNVIVFDLRHNIEELLRRNSQENALCGESDDSQVELSSRSSESSISKALYPIVKELCYNKCPAVAPLGVLNEADGWNKIGLSVDKVKENWRILCKHPEIIKKIQEEYSRIPEFPPAVEPEQALYDGFLNDADKLKVESVRNATKEKLADYHPDFDDERLPGLLLHYKGRNFPETLSETEMEKWEADRRARLERQYPEFLKALEVVEDDFIRDELKLYLESLA